MVVRLVVIQELAPAGLVSAQAVAAESALAAAQVGLSAAVSILVNLATAEAVAAILVEAEQVVAVVVMNHHLSHLVSHLFL